MQPIFFFRADTVSSLIEILSRDHSDQSKVVLRLLKIILQCKNPNDILSKFSNDTDTQQTLESKKTKEKERHTKEEDYDTKEEDMLETNLHSDHSVTIDELESAFNNQNLNTHRNEYPIFSLFNHMHTSINHLN